MGTTAFSLSLVSLSLPYLSLSLHMSAREAANLAGGAGGKLIAVIGDEETVAGMLLAGVGHKNAGGQNYLVVNDKTKRSTIEQTFKTFTDTRNDIAIVLVNQHVANSIRHLVDGYDKTLPTVLEIPSKDHPYDPAKDSIMKRVNLMLGLGNA